MAESRTFWLSFCDDARPAGERFLGVSVVDVSAEDVAAIRDELHAKFPHAAEGAEWIAAASRKAWRMGCNPGGQMLSASVDPSAETVSPEERAEIASIPRNRLLTPDELARYGERMTR